MTQQPSFNDLYGDDAPETPKAGEADLVSTFSTLPSPPSPSIAYPFLQKTMDMYLCILT